MNNPGISPLLALVGGLLFAPMTACDTPSTAPDLVAGLPLPAGFPAMAEPEDNPWTEAKFQLGRHLFYDATLSANGKQACGSCHEQDRAFADGLVTPKGSTGHILARNSQGLTNVGYNATLTWANPNLRTIEAQVLVPIFGESPIELGATGHEDEILARFANDPLYRDLFAQAFPDAAEPIIWDHIAKGLAAFVRGLVSGDSPFDRYVYGDQDDAMSAAQLRGMEIFFSERLECHHCHGGFNFSDSTVHAGSVFEASRFHNTGLYNLDGKGAYPANNTGLFDISERPEDMGKFRPPTLRNIELTAPYMHDGAFATLEDVLRSYEAGGTLIEEGPMAGDGRISPLKSGLVAGFTLTDTERTDLIAFLKALTDERFVTDPRFADPFSESAER